MEMKYSSEVPADVQRNTWRYIRESRTLHNQRCEDLKSCMQLWCSRLEGGSLEWQFCETLTLFLEYICGYEMILISSNSVVTQPRATESSRLQNGEKGTYTYLDSLLRNMWSSQQMYVE
jgi:hypothetical protein